MFEDDCRFRKGVKGPDAVSWKGQGPVNEMQLGNMNAHSNTRHRHASKTNTSYHLTHTHTDNVVGSGEWGGVLSSRHEQIRVSHAWYAQPYIGGLPTRNQEAGLLHRSLNRTRLTQHDANRSHGREDSAVYAVCTRSLSPNSCSPSLHPCLPRPQKGIIGKAHLHLKISRYTD